MVIILKPQVRKPKIGQAPEPYIICRVCKERIQGLESLEAHAQLIHPEFYDNVLDKIHEMMDNGLTLDEMVREIKHVEIV